MAQAKYSDQKKLIVFFDIQIESEDIGRMEFELFTKNTPLTCENFRCLCTGEKGKSQQDPSKDLHYKNNIFHRIIPGFMAQGGDIIKQNGTGKDSIYGPNFSDENFIDKHTEMGCLSMANGGPNTNSSQFFITFVECPHLDNKHTVFGKLIKGEKVLKMIEQQGTPSGKPKKKVQIIACGQYGMPL